MDYFNTDWAAMTNNDWVGTIITTVVFIFMLAMYIYYLRPSKKEYFENMKNIPLDEGASNEGEKNV